MFKKSIKSLYLYNEATIWFSNNDHDHSIPNNNNKKIFGINKKTKVEIEKIYNSGYKTATKIIIKLREKINEFEDGKKTDDSLIPNPN